MVVDVTKYIDDSGMIDLKQVLRDHGYAERDLMSLPLDTVALARLLKVSEATVRKYVNIGLIELDPRRRITLKDALDLNFATLQKQLKIMQPMRSKPNRRKN